MNEDQLFDSENIKVSEVKPEITPEIKSEEKSEAPTEIKSEEKPNATSNNSAAQPPRTVNYNTNYNTNYEKGKSKTKGCLFWGLIALGIFITINGLIFFGIIGMVFSDTDTEESYIGTNYVETLRIEGTIASENVNSYGIPIGYQHQWTLERIKNLISDDYNKGILLYINSGGGGVYESDELYLALKEYKNKTNRPVYAYYAQTAASGAVYASMAADEIFSNRMTMTGSIGVKVTTYNVSELMKKLGIQETSVTSGANKNMFSSTEPVTQEQLDIVQAMIDESYDIFVGIISEARNIPLENVRKLADGRIYTPVQALDLKLIDGICTYDEFMTSMTEKPQFSDCEFIDGTYIDNSLLGTFFSKLPEKPLSEVDLLTGILKNSENCPIKY